MAWIESHQELENHPKLINLSQKMGWNRFEASGRLHHFWKWCLNYACTGSLNGLTDSTLAQAVGLVTDAGTKFMTAMTEVTSRWIDYGQGETGELILRVHNWPKYTKKFLKESRFRDRPEKWQEVLRIYEVKVKVWLPYQSDSGVTLEKSAVPNLTNLTLPNLTLPNQKALNTISQIPNFENLLILFGSAAIQEKIKIYLERNRMKNKSKIMSEGRKDTLTRELLNTKDRCKDDSLFGQAVDLAISYDACNIGYVNSIIKNRKASRPR